MGSEVLGLSLELIIVFLVMFVFWDGINFSFLFFGFVVILGGKVGVKFNIKILVVLLYI